MNPGDQITNSIAVTQFFQELVDMREIPQDYPFLRRTAIVDAEPDEIMARFTGYVAIADLIGDDAAAMTYDAGKLSFQNDVVPNIKHGINYSSSQIVQLRNLQQRGMLMNPNTPGTQGEKRSPVTMTTFQKQNANNLLLGIYERLETLIIAMYADGFSYDRLGIIMDNVSWGMPADLKVSLTGAAQFQNPTTSAPITAINNYRRNARVRYHAWFNRLSMSQPLFDAIVKSDEFATLAKNYLPFGFSVSAMPLAQTGWYQDMLMRVLSGSSNDAGQQIKEIEIIDSRYWQRNEDASLTSSPRLALDKILFSTIENDNKPMVMDLANAVVNESMLADMFPGVQVPDALVGEKRGPVSYVTVPPHMNPAQATQWAVMKAFPRKFMRHATGAMSCGTFSDTIAVGAPY